MATKQPVKISHTDFVEIAASACLVQALKGAVYIRHDVALPTATEVIIDDYPYDGHVIQSRGQVEHASHGYSGADKTYARAVNEKGAIIVVTET